MAITPRLFAIPYSRFVGVISANRRLQQLSHRPSPAVHSLVPIERVVPIPKIWQKLYALI
jgi:hypothetical protein